MHNKTSGKRGYLFLKKTCTLFSVLPHLMVYKYFSVERYAFVSRHLEMRKHIQMCMYRMVSNTRNTLMGCLRPTKDLLFGILEPCVYPDRIYESILAFRNSAGPFGHKLGGENKDTLVFLHKKGGVL